MGNAGGPHLSPTMSSSLSDRRDKSLSIRGASKAAFREESAIGIWPSEENREDRGGSPIGAEFEEAFGVDCKKP
ncbi:hypothetical protein NliqN6_1989 [Naganishia liquefaciens]|uniref:Uncharacterized protein n=1 Tax=Naganishia liquefaciens TaxID=104408 RepID=A0A8H3YET9_9TREE|nr:hypothetical protein NliqN6_1989 [Naganishia liquefaciens]